VPDAILPEAGQDAEWDRRIGRCSVRM